MQSVLRLGHQLMPPVSRMCFLVRCRAMSTPTVSLSEQINSYIDNLACEVSSLREQRSLDSSQRQKLVQYQEMEKRHIHLRALLREVQELKKMRDEEKDDELREAANIDLEAVQKDLDAVTEELSAKLVPPEDFDENDAVLEVTSGAGGSEAAIFAHEIFDMYLNYAATQLGFEVSILATESSTTAAANKNKSTSVHGLKRGEAKISGQNVFKKLKLECGVHRVQRVPLAGSKADRLQTSTCAVAVLPMPTVEELSLPKSELRVDFMRSSGPGGQAVNTSDTCVRIVHLPSNTAVECQETRSQTRNHELALDRLRRLLYERVYEERMRSIAASRRVQVGSLNRNEKVRSYNFARNTITEHRSGMVRQVGSLKALFKEGAGLNVVREMSEALQRQLEKERLKVLLEEAQQRSDSKSKPLRN